MKIKITIDGKEVTLSQESIEAIQNLTQKKKYNYENWRGAFWLKSDGHIENVDYGNSFGWDDEFNQGNIFPTKQEAEREKEIKQAKHNIKKYIIENGLEFEPDWEKCNEKKYHIFCNYRHKEFKIDYRLSTNCADSFFFKSEKNTQQVIDNCGKDLKVLFNLK